MIQKTCGGGSRAKNLVLSLALSASGPAALAEEWYLAQEVRTPTPDSAFICHVWNAEIFGPGEKGSCLVGTIFAVDLVSRQISYVNVGAQGMGRSAAEREIQRDALGRALRGEGQKRLEQLRVELVQARDATQQKADADEWRERYLADFTAATTLPAILEFEKGYTGKDPDGLIARLAATKAELQQKQYRDEYQQAQTPARLSEFIARYQDSDPDKLVPEAAKRKLLAEKSEALTKQGAEKKERLVPQRLESRRVEEARRTKQLASQGAADRERSRLQFISDLQKYAARIVAQTPQAFKLVAAYKIDCQASDRRELPLLNVLYASMRAFERDGVESWYHLQNRGSQVRIFIEARKNGKSLGDPTLAYELNEWGELRPVGITTEAVRNTCFGSYGPIWLMPGEPGY